MIHAVIETGVGDCFMYSTVPDLLFFCFHLGVVALYSFGSIGCVYGVYDRLMNGIV